MRSRMRYTIMAGEVHQRALNCAFAPPNFFARFDDPVVQREAFSSALEAM